MPISYNFVSEVFFGGHRPSSASLSDLLTELDYINVHVYGGSHSNRNQDFWTPLGQIGAFKGESAAVIGAIPSDILDKTPVIIGETGYQSRGYRATSKARMHEYYERVTQYVYSPESLTPAMFYFNLNDEAWKGGDDAWGLYEEGSAGALGAAKFAVAKADDIINRPVRLGACSPSDAVWNVDAG